MGVYVFVDAYGDGINILTYSTKAQAVKSIKSYMQGNYSIDDEDIDEVIEAIFNADYGKIMCEYRVPVEEALGSSAPSKKFM